jgi:hypothetical protein
MASRSPSNELSLLLQLLSEGYEKKTWHGPNLRQSLHGVSARTAAWRPGRGRHNIWELALHAAYWKYAVRRRLVAGMPASFTLKGSNWFVMPASHTDAEWRRCKKLLENEHRKMVAVIAKLSPREIQKHVRMIFGVAYHDIYHAGQIRMLRRLQESRK